MKKIGGWILTLAGLVVIALGVKGLQEYILKVIPFSSFLSSVPKTYSMIGGLVLVIIGIVLLNGTGSAKQSPEVPIYQGKRIVGYRRH